MLLSEAIHEFLAWKELQVQEHTKNQYVLVLRQFCLYMRDCPLYEVQTRDITNWFSLMRKLGYQQNTFIPRSIAMRKFFEFFYRQGLTKVDPFLIPVPNKDIKPVRVASEEDFCSLIRTIPQTTENPRLLRNKAFLGLLWDAGARVSELCSLNVHDLDLSSRCAEIKTAKNKGSKPFRKIFWSHTTNQWLQDWLIKRRDLAQRRAFLAQNAVFICINNKYGDRLTNKGIGELLRRMSHNAGIAVVNAHSFRHRMGRHLASHGASNTVISEILGHASLQSSYTYTRLDNVEIEKQYRKLVNE